MWRFGAGAATLFVRKTISTDVSVARLFGSEAVRNPAGCLADDQFGLDHGLTSVRIRLRTADAAQQSLGGDPSHFAQRLAHSGQRGILVGGALNIVEADDGNIVGHAQPASRRARIAPIAEISLKANRAVKGLCDASNFRVASYPSSGDGESPSSCEIRAGRSQTQMAGRFLDVGPADFGIGTEFLSFDEGDLAVAEMK